MNTPPTNFAHFCRKNKIKTFVPNFPLQTNKKGELDTTKQGLQKVDQVQVNKQIFDMTHGSARDERNREKLSDADERIQRMIARKRTLTPAQVLQAQHALDDEIDQQFQELFAKLPRVICVVDFDCFFCAVEQRDRPELQQKPIAVVGGGIVSASNYVARKMGVRSAMPTNICKRLCPSLVLIEGNTRKYEKVSKQAEKIFRQFDPNYAMMSVDEVQLDITPLVYKQATSGQPCGSAERLSSQTNSKFLRCDPVSAIELAAAQVVHQLRQQVAATLHITASAGVSVTVQLAKMFTDINKPNGQTVGRL